MMAQLPPCKHGHPNICRPTNIPSTGTRVFATALLAALLLVACATPLKTRYYTLSGEAPPEAKSQVAAPRYRVAIGPVSVPEAIDRLPIVLSIAPNRYSISDAERWSEPLKNELPYLIARHVAQHLRAARVSAYLQYSGQDADFRVLIDVTRFEFIPGKTAILEATWSVRDRSGKRLREVHSAYAEPVQAPGVAQLVAAQARSVGTLGREIAATVSVIARSRP